MLHARLLTEVKEYQHRHFDPGGAEDRPLFGQLAGHDPKVVLSAARLIEDNVDAVDLNFGCPQALANQILTLDNRLNVARTYAGDCAQGPLWRVSSR